MPFGGGALKLIANILLDNPAQYRKTLIYCAAMENCLLLLHINRHPLGLGFQIRKARIHAFRLRGG